MLESWEEPIDPAEDPFRCGVYASAHASGMRSRRAAERIRAGLNWANSACSLLHGVTGSGKTEVYLRAVQETLARGKTALVLVPEIALTLWIGRQCRFVVWARFEGRRRLAFGAERCGTGAEWWRVRNGEARVVVGTRSRCLRRWKMSGSYRRRRTGKQLKQEETPRYHRPDVAIVRAKMEGRPGRCWVRRHPRWKTYHHARNGK